MGLTLMSDPWGEPDENHFAVRPIGTDKVANALMYCQTLGFRTK